MNLALESKMPKANGTGEAKREDGHIPTCIFKNKTYILFHMLPPMLHTTMLDHQDVGR